MGLGDLCYKSGGSLAYSKVDGESLIYKGTWGFTLSWSGTSQNGVAFNAGSVSYSGSPQSDYSWTCELVGYYYCIALNTAEVWWQTGAYGFSRYCDHEPTPWRAPPEPQIWYTPRCSIVFYRSNWDSYGGGFGVRAFSNSSSDINGDYSQTDNNANYSCSIGSVGVIDVGWK